MLKFGEIINKEIPVLIDFYNQWNENSTPMSETLRHVSAALGDRAQVIKIDVEKNIELAKALKIKGLPTFILYNHGKMIWRESGEIDANTLINKVENLFNN